MPGSQFYTMDVSLAHHNIFSANTLLQEGSSQGLTELAQITAKQEH
jgi:hypothetical protein